VNIRDLLAEARRLLAAGSEGRLEAEVLLCHILKGSRAFIYANPDQEVSAGHRGEFLRLVQRRRSGEPIAYLTGIREFWSLSLRVTPDVLIPRPETELLVETALAHIPVDAAWRIADLGTGSGAIALAIASERPLCDVHATDTSPAALRIAQENADTLQLGQIRFHLGSWLAPLQGKFNVIISNPPYVASDDPHMGQGDCRFEPQEALSPGPDALASIRHIAGVCLSFLEDDGFLAFEHGFEQGDACRKLLLELGYSDIETVKDLAGLDRVTKGKKS